jgi:hypothetical protein
VQEGGCKWNGVYRDVSGQCTKTTQQTMGEIKDEINWENFLDNYFDLFRPLTEKKEYKNGLTIHYKKNRIYVWTDLSVDRLTIKKLEFGRLTTDEAGQYETNWIKGVFINDEHFYTTFLQTSFCNCNLPKILDSLKVAFHTFKHQNHEKIKVYRNTNFGSVERVHSRQERCRHLWRTLD